MSDTNDPSMSLKTARSLGRLFRDLTRNLTGHETVRLLAEFGAGRNDHDILKATLPLPIQRFDNETGESIDCDRSATLSKTDLMFGIDFPTPTEESQGPVQIDFKRLKTGFYMTITESRGIGRRTTIMINDTGRVEILTR